MVKKIRIKRFNSFQRKILLLVSIIFMLTIGFTLGRYVYHKVLDFYFRTQNFYFESDKLTASGASYSLDYWNGVDPYQIVVNLNSFKNNELKSDHDIEYQVKLNCSDTIICNSTKNKGTIYQGTNTDSFVVTITPSQAFKDGDSVVAYIEAESTSPYHKKLSAQFKLVVGTYGLSHEISDHENDVYLEVKVTNTLLTYTVKEAFGTYQVGEQISISQYNELSDEEKKKCVSASITLKFNPNEVYVDNNSTTYLNSYQIKTEKINNYDYINEFTFDMDASSSSVVKFYKKDVTKDYSSDGSTNGIVKVYYEY